MPQREHLDDTVVDEHGIIKMIPYATQKNAAKLDNSRMVNRFPCMWKIFD